MDESFPLPLKLDGIEWIHGAIGMEKIISINEKMHGTIKERL